MKKHLTSNHGITLIEVLVTLVIMAIASAGIYGTFTTGLKLYQKIGIEGKLRDDADYAVTMILNEMYENPPSYVSDYKEDNKEGIKLVRYGTNEINDEDNYKYNYIIKEPDLTKPVQESLIYFENQRLYFKPVIVDGVTQPPNELTEISSENSIYTTVTDGTKIKIPKIKLEDDCSQEDLNGKCQHGRISLTIVIEDREQGVTSFLKTEPLVLESTFGF